MSSDPPPNRPPAPPDDLPAESSPPPRPRVPGAGVPVVDFQLDDLTSGAPSEEKPSSRPRFLRSRSEPLQPPAEAAPTAPTEEVTPEDVPPSPAPAAARPARRRRGIKPGWVVVSGLLTLGLLFLTWSQVPIKTVQVSGNTHLTNGEVRRLAGLPQDQSPFGWLYYGAWKAKGLLASPWIVSAEVTRQFPDTVILAVSERQPFARWQRPGAGEVLVSEDGTTLPTGAGIVPGDLARLPVVTGWGPERLSEALRLTRALSRYTVQSVTYTPAGFTAKTASGTAWGGDLETFVKYAGSIGMYPNKKIHIYPWGVSVQE